MEDRTIASIRQTLEAQNLTWKQLGAEFSALPPVEFAVREDWLEPIERALDVGVPNALPARTLRV